MITRYQWGVFEVDLNPIVGSEQGGRRPVLVVSNEPFNHAMSVLTVLPLTSTQRRLYPAEVALPKRAAGQPLDSIIMAHQIRTISKRRVAGLLGYVSDPSFRRLIQKALLDHLDLT